jgi:hypothetical protein
MGERRVAGFGDIPSACAGSGHVRVAHGGTRREGGHGQTFEGHRRRGVRDRRTPPGDAYRAVYAVQLDEDIWVLHAFRKKSKTGIKTPRHEIDLIRERIKRITEQLS